MAEKKTKGKKEASALSADRQAALAKVMQDMDKTFGKGTLMRLGDKQKIEIDAIPTGSIALDMALGVGGIPKGRIVEIYGPESSGKTTVALHMIAECQKDGGVAAFIDAEHALDPIYAQKIGVDIENLYVSQPDNGEQALEVCDALVRSGAVDILVIDSVAALTPRAEIEGEMGDSHVGLLARLMSQALRKLTANVNKNDTTLVFINQVREKIGIVYGNPEVTTGGRALKFYASVRMEVRKGEAIKQGSDIIGNRTKVKIVKNKVAPPFKVAEFDIMFGEGISKVGDLVDMGVEMGIVKKSGAWFAYKDERIGQGRENAKNFLKEHPAIAEEIEKLIREKSQKIQEDAQDEYIADYGGNAMDEMDDDFLDMDFLGLDEE